MNQTGNQTGTNMTTTAGGSGGDQAAAKMHLGEAIKTLQAADDTTGAEMHAQVVQNTL
jgi:hypothetical protein